jgi:hypothetical protein
MPYKTNLELFESVALAYLMDGPKAQTALREACEAVVMEELRGDE